jgi:hypothetical protein
MGIRMSDVSVRPGARPSGSTRTARTAGGTKAYVAPPLAPPRGRPPSSPRRGFRGDPPPRQALLLPRTPEPPRTTAPPRTDSGPPPDGARQHRMPFIILLCGLLAGALASLLVISTTLATGAYRITSLQAQVNSLTLQRQQLQEQVSSDNSAQMIATRAEALGMHWQGLLRFIDLKTGKVRTDAGSGADAQIDVPGYTP